MWLVPDPFVDLSPLKLPDPGQGSANAHHGPRMTGQKYKYVIQRTLSPVKGLLSLAM